MLPNENQQLSFPAVTQLCEQMFLIKPKNVNMF